MAGSHLLSSFLIIFYATRQTVKNSSILYSFQTIMIRIAQSLFVFRDRLENPRPYSDCRSCWVCCAGISGI